MSDEATYRAVPLFSEGQLKIGKKSRKISGETLTNSGKNRKNTQKISEKISLKNRFPEAKSLFPTMQAAASKVQTSITLYSILKGVT